MLNQNDPLFPLNQNDPLYSLIQSNDPLFPLYYSNQFDQVTNTNTQFNEHKFDIRENIKLEILSVKNVDRISYENLKDKDEDDLLSVIHNCLNTETRIENQNRILLKQYFKLGSLLNRIVEILENEHKNDNNQLDLSKISERNKISGLIKGSGIARKFIKDNMYGHNESKRAREFYKKAVRVFKIYKSFLSPFSQIDRSETISAFQFIEYYTNEEFDKLVNEVEGEVARNSVKYNCNAHDDGNINYSIITNEIINKVKFFLENPNNVANI